MTHSISGTQESNKVKWMNRVSAKALNQRTAEENEWREKLQTGDYIDAVCCYATPNSSAPKKFIQAWQPAKIELADNEGNLLVSFLRLPRSMNQKINRNSPQIAVANSHTDTWEWRFNMKKGDEFSCCDEYGNWYHSTCMSIDDISEFVDIDKNPVPKIRVGYRYIDPNGSKSDESGVKWTGWIAQKFEQDMYLAQPNIQPLKSMSYHYTIVQAEMMSQYQIHVRDSDDVVFSSSTIHEWAKLRDDDKYQYFGGLQAISDIINEFGQIGGFEIIETILTQIADGQFEASAKYLLGLQQFLLKTLPLWTRQFVCTYAEKIANCYMRAITSEHSSITKRINLEEINQLAFEYQSLLKRNFTMMSYEQKSAQLKIKLGSSLLLSENLQKRISGIKLVTDEIRSLLRYGNTQEQQRQIMEDFVKIDLFNMVFHPHRLHMQILQRSQEIIKIYAKQQKLTQEHIDLLWHSAQIDETAQIEVYKVFQASSGLIPDEVIEMFINKVRDYLDPQKTTVRDVDFVHTVGKNAHYKSSARSKAVQVLWQIALMEKPGYSKSLLKPARKQLFDLVRNQDREIVESYIHKTIDIIEMQGQASVQATKLLIKLLDSEKIPKYVYQNQYGVQTQKNLSQFVHDLCVNNMLLDKIIDDLKAKQGEDKKQIWTRLKALLFLQNSMDDKSVLQAEQVIRLWNMLFESNETSLFFDYFQKVLSNQEWCAQNSDMICDLFQSKVLNNQQQILRQAVHLNGFQCIQQLFLCVNERSNMLNISNMKQNIGQKDKRAKLDFRVHVMPSQLEGMSFLWQYFQVSCYQSDASDLKASIAKFIAQIYGSISNIVKSQSDVYAEFTNQCFSGMQTCMASNKSDVFKSELVKNTMLLLQSFFAESEKRGTACIRPHSTLGTETELFSNILATSYVTTNQSKPKHFLLNLPSVMTVWELIDFIACKLDKSPFEVNISRAHQKTVISQGDYCKTLKQLGFTSNEEISVLKKVISTSRLPLINTQTGQLVREAEAIFESWFMRYSVPAEEIADIDYNVSTKAGRYMTKQTALEFLQNAMSDSQKLVVKKLSPDDTRIINLFQTCDLDKDDLLTQQDFIRFYRMKSNQNPDTVWLNLQAHSYNNNLLKEVKGDLTYSSETTVTRDQSMLPRSFIADNLSQLELLLSMTDNHSSDQIWQLISSLKTNSELYANILEATSLTDLLSPEQPTLKLQYNLQIVKHLLHKYSAQEQSIQAVAVMYLERAKVTQSYNDDFPKMDDERPIYHENSEGEDDEGYKNLGAKRNQAGSHWEQPKVVQSSDVIALPSAADQAPQNQKLSYQQQQIANWKGDIIKEDLCQAQQIDQLWLIKFLQNQGLNALVNLLEHFVAKDALESQADRNCVMLITHMLKVILTAAFCANESEQSKKMSGLNQIQEYSSVIELLQLHEFKPEQLIDNDPQMTKFHKLLQSTFRSILQKQNGEQIVAECLNIWILLITYHSDKLLDFFEDQSFLNLLIDFGLLSSNQQLRNQIKETLLFVSTEVQHDVLPVHPQVFICLQLVNKLSHVCKLSNTLEYFTLLQSSLRNYYKIKYNNQGAFIDIYDANDLTRSALELLNTLQSQEQKNKTKVDYSLVGLLDLVRNLIIFEDVAVLDQQERSIVLKMLVEKCLFNQQSEKFDKHITAQVTFNNQTTINKCHTNESREAAYSLFQALLGSEPNTQVMQDLIRNYWAPAIMSLAGAQQIVLKDKDNRSELGFAGLKNLGCICYMNAIIQQFYHVPAFRYCLLAADDFKDANLVTLPDGRQLDDNFLHQWKRMFGHLELTDRECYNPQDFCYSYKTRGQPTNVREQCDAQEFITGSFDKIEESLKGTPMRHLLKSVFQGVSTNITMCKDCFNIMQTDEDFGTLHLSVKNQKDIYASLKFMVAGEIVTGYKCDGCNKTVEIEKKLAIKKLPNTLIVHLNRIVFDFDKMSNIKLNDRLEFPNVLNVQDFMLDQVLKKIGKPEDQKMEIDEDSQNPKDFEYKLVGVVIHMGTADAGHYISYINVDRNQDSQINTEQWLKTETQQWMEFNDSQVRTFDFSQLGYKCFGEATGQADFKEEYHSTAAQAAHNAYMLVYEKTVKQPLQIVLDQAAIQQMQSLVCDGTTIPRELMHPTLCMSQLSTKVLNNEYSSDFIVEVPFHSVTKFIPNSIFQQVHHDNQVHIAESQVYCNPFFKTTCLLLKNLVKSADDQVKQDVYVLLDKLLFDLLPRTSQNSEMPSLTELMLELISEQPDLLQKLIRERLLFFSKVSDNICDYPFFEMLIFHKEQAAREMCEQILTKVVAILFSNLEYHNISKLSDVQIQMYQDDLKELIQTAVGVIPGKLQNAWPKLGAFFNFFFNTLKELTWSKLITFKKVNLVQKFVDFICKMKEPLTSGYNYGLPPIEFVIQTISVLARAQPLLIWLYKIPLNQQVSIEEYESLKDSKQSPYGLDLTESFYLDFEDVKSLFMAEKRTKAFWEICISYSMSAEALEAICKLMAHCCYNNFEFSKKMGKILIVGLNKTHVDELRPFAVAMKWFLTINDVFQHQRTEWLCGIPSISYSKQTNSYYNQDLRQSYKIGASKITSIDDILYEYHCPLIKDQSKYLEPVLYILYNYRKSGFADVVLVMLEYFLLSIYEDKSQKLLQFILDNPSPSYTGARYWDWIEPFIQQNILEVFQSNQPDQVKTETNLRILETIQKITAEFNDRLAAEQPAPYLIWDITQVKEMETFRVHNKEVHVVIQEFTCSISKSTPNPAEQLNENLVKSNRGMWNQAPVFQVQQSKRNNNTHKSMNVRKTYGRGKRHQPGQKRKPYAPNNDQDVQADLTEIDMPPLTDQIDENQNDNWSDKLNLSNEEPVQNEMPFEDSDKEVETETTKYETACVMEIVLRNFSRQKAQTVTLVFTEEYPGAANFKLPYCGLSQKVASTTDHTFFKFQKIRPFEDWGKFNLQILVDSVDSDMVNHKYEHNWCELRKSRQEIVAEQMASFQAYDAVDGYTNYDDGGSVPDVTGLGSGIIECPICTFHNESVRDKCEMCDTAL